MHDDWAGYSSSTRENLRRFFSRWLFKTPAAVQALDCRQMQTITIPRLYIWTRQGWVPALMVGTQWDVKQWRIQYRANHVCTAFIKCGLNAT